MNNEAALGYALMAARSIEMSERNITQLLAIMVEAMDEYTEEEAEEVAEKA